MFHFIAIEGQTPGMSRSEKKLQNNNYTNESYTLCI